MHSATPPPQFPPPWTQHGFAKKLVQVNTTKNSLNPTFLAHVLIALAIGVGAIVLYFTTLAFLLILAKQWRICPGEYSQSQISQSQIDHKPPVDQKQAPRPAAVSPVVTLSPADPRQEGVTLPDLNEIYNAINRLDARIMPDQKARLRSQVAQLRDAQFTACTIGVFFFANRNATLTVCTAAAILALSSLAFVSKNGWEGTNNAIINVGLSSALILFTAWSISQLFGQGVNYENQRAKVVLATNLLNSVASAVANKTAVSMAGKPGADAKPEEKILALVDDVNMALLIRSIDKQLEVINDLDFGGDSSFAEDAAKKVGKLLNGASLPGPAKP